MVKVRTMWFYVCPTIPTAFEKYETTDKWRDLSLSRFFPRHVQLGHGFVVKRGRSLGQGVQALRHTRIAESRYKFEASPRRWSQHRLIFGRSVVERCVGGSVGGGYPRELCGRSVCESLLCKQSIESSIRGGSIGRKGELAWELLPRV